MIGNDQKIFVEINEQATARTPWLLCNSAPDAEGLHPDALSQGYLFSIGSLAACETI